MRPHVVLEGEKPGDELMNALKLSKDQINLARRSLGQATALLSSVQKQCPHNNVHMSINTCEYYCADCEADLVENNGKFEWSGPGTRYELDNFFWDRS